MPRHAWLGGASIRVSSGACAVGQLAKRAAATESSLSSALRVMSGDHIPVGSSVLRQSAADDGDVDSETITYDITVPMVFLPDEIIPVQVSIRGGTSLTGALRDAQSTPLTDLTVGDFKLACVRELLRVGKREHRSVGAWVLNWEVRTLEPVRYS